MLNQRVIKSLAISLFLLTLAGCASPSDYAIKHARQDFAAQNYGEAFNHLKSAVKYHDKRVEYAIGYCYYNGYGTDPDPYHARYYISRSAWQMYMPAIEAMKLFDQPLPTFKNIIRKSALATRTAKRRLAPHPHRVMHKSTAHKRKAASVANTALPAPARKSYKTYRTAPAKQRSIGLLLPIPQHTEAAVKRA